MTTTTTTTAITTPSYFFSDMYVPTSTQPTGFCLWNRRSALFSISFHRLSSVETVLWECWILGYPRVWEAPEYPTYVQALYILEFSLSDFKKRKMGRKGRNHIFPSPNNQLPRYLSLLLLYIYLYDLLTRGSAISFFLTTGRLEPMTTTTYLYTPLSPSILLYAWHTYTCTHTHTYTVVRPSVQAQINKRRVAELYETRSSFLSP